MKKSFYILALVSFALMAGFPISCNKTPTYDEMKAAEMKLIRRIISERKMEVLDEYPKNGVFGENQFVKLSNGIYLHVVDSGNGERAVFDGYNSTDILVRVQGSYYEKVEKRDTVYNFSTFSNGSSPMEFKYGFANSVVNEHQYSYYDPYYYFFGMAIESMLSYVGDSAVISMLVPGHAEIGSYTAGSTMQAGGSTYKFVPIFYDRIRYIFYK